MVVPALLGCTSHVVLLGGVMHTLLQRKLAQTDAIAALACARKAYGLKGEGPNPQVGGGGGRMSINSGDLVGVTTTTTNAAFIRLDKESSSGLMVL